MNNKSMRFELRLTSGEKSVLRRKAQKAGLSVSEYVRQMLVHSDDTAIVFVDTSPFREALAELCRQGANLNQMAKVFNTYGLNEREGALVKSIHENLGETYLKIEGALIALREEADKHKVVIDFERCAMFDDEE